MQSATVPTPGRVPRTDRRERVAGALARLHHAVATRPGFGRTTARATAELGDGVRCRTTERDRLVITDLGPALGGDDTAPSPSQLVRAALGACLAMTYQLRAAERGIELTSVRVTVETDSELRGMLRPDDVSPGFTAVRYHVDITSPAARADVAALVDDSDRLSPVLADLTRPLTVERTVSIADSRPGA